MSAKTCKWQQCAGTVQGQGYCSRHYQILRHLGRLQGGKLDPTPVRERICAHRTRGRNGAELARLAEVHPQTISHILTGHYRSVQTEIAGRIMAVPLGPSSIGLARRVRALCRIGHSLKAIAAEAGVGWTGLAAATEQERFSPRLTAAIMAVYPRLSVTPGPSRLAARKAELAGNVPPMAWEGLDIDDPDAIPDAGQHTERTDRELIDEFLWLTRGGSGRGAALTALGVTETDLLLAQVALLAQGFRVDLGEPASGTCAVCRGALPDRRHPNVKTCSPECRKVNERVVNARLYWIRNGQSQGVAA